MIYNFSREALTTRSAIHVLRPAGMSERGRGSRVCCYLEPVGIKRHARIQRKVINYSVSRIRTRTRSLGRSLGKWHFENNATPQNISNTINKLYLHFSSFERGWLSLESISCINWNELSYEKYFPLFL